MITLRRKLVALAALTSFAVPALVPAVALAAPETKELFRKTRTANWDHLPTFDPNEGNQSGYYVESSTHIYSQPYGGTGGTPSASRPIYRCLVNGWDHMISLSSSCEGTKSEGLLGYVLTSSASGHIPMYRCRNDQNNGEHFWSSSSTCEGKTTEALLGYVLPSSSGGTENSLNSGVVNNDCIGRCGLGCSWMPWEAVTSQCRAHDECVRDHGHLACVGKLLPAAISYVAVGLKTLVRSIMNKVKSFFRWF